MLNRAYSLLEVKLYDGKSGRQFSGIATTPTPDRELDVIEPLGVKFSNPLQLHLFHRGDQPVGQVTFGTPTPKGIPFTATIPEIAEPGEVKTLTDKAAHLVKYGLIRAVSIGFRPLDGAIERLKSGGVRFLKTEVVELSLVSIPANEQASISYVKSLNAAAPALSGTGARESSNSPAVVGSASKARTMTTNAQPISDQVATAQAELKTKSARLEELVLKDGADGGLEDAEQTELTTVRGEVEKLSSRVKSLSALEAAQAAMARELVVRPTPTSTSAMQHTSNPHVEVKSNLQPGIEFARYVICQMASIKYRRDPVALAKQYFPDNPRIELLLKDNIPAGTATDNLFAKPLVNPTTLVSEFLEFLRPQTIIGRIPGLRRVPFNVRITGQSSGATGYWVGEGQSKPLTRYGFTATTLTWAKVAAIIAITDELARFSSPSAETLVRDEIAAALQERIDIDFTNPDKSASAGVSPASITNGVTNLNDTGSSLANTNTDIAQFFNAMITNNFNIAECVWIMPNSVALQLSLMRDSAGALAFPTMSVTGGTWQGLPVVTSQHLVFSHTPANNKVILVHAPSIALADDGGFTIDVSREASLEMDDQPVMAASSTAGSPSGPTGSALVSMFQTNSIAIRCERYINWARLRTGAVVWMDDVRWAA